MNDLYAAEPVPPAVAQPDSLQVIASQDSEPNLIDWHGPSSAKGSGLAGLLHLSPEQEIRADGGQAIGVRFAYSETEPISPRAATYNTAKPFAVFYGAIEIVSHGHATADLATAVRSGSRVLDQVGGESLISIGAPASHSSEPALVRGLIFWPLDLSRDHAAGHVTIGMTDVNCILSDIVQLYRENSFVRFAVKSGDSWYLSGFNQNHAGQAVHEDHGWALWPVSEKRLPSPPPHYPVTAAELNDIRCAGVYFQSTSDDPKHNAVFGLSSFRLERRASSSAPNTGAPPKIAVPAPSAVEVNLEQRYVDRDGYSVSCLVRPGSPTLVLATSSHQDYRQYLDMLSFLVEGLGILIVELPGHRESRVLPEAVSIETFADDVLAAIQQAAPAAYFVGGHSIGGMVALEVGRRAPDGLKGVISIEGWTSGRAAAAFRGLDMYGTQTPELRERQAELRKLATGHLSPNDRSRFSQIWEQWRHGLEFLETTELPVLQLWGDRGRPRPRLTQLHIPERPNIQVHWFTGASHNLPLERPVELAGVIREFIGRIEDQQREGSK